MYLVRKRIMVVVYIISLSMEPFHHGYLSSLARTRLPKEKVEGGKRLSMGTGKETKPFWTCRRCKGGVAWRVGGSVSWLLGHSLR
ncbi:hypothetical protein ACFX19_020415 [Malus domestica]